MCCRFGRLASSVYFERWEHALQSSKCDAYCQDALNTVSTALDVHHVSANVSQLELMADLQVWLSREALTATAEIVITCCTL